MADSMSRTAWMHEKKWGVFVHHLEQIVNNPDHPSSMGKHTTWDEALLEFDCDRFADQLAEAGAGWCVLTLMQRTRFLLAPNDTFCRITGYAPGEACPKTDFLARMIRALDRHGIALLLYFTGDGPRDDKQAQRAFGCYGPEPEPDFVEKWAEVAREYSLRYGEKIRGWWQDGMWIGYTPELLKKYADAFRAGNPEAVIASNFYGCHDEYGELLTRPRPGCPYDDFSAGEIVHLGALPQLGAAVFGGRPIRWHILSFLGNPADYFEAGGWAKPGSRYTPGWMFDYVDGIHRRGGIITLDICVRRDGVIDEEQMRVLRVLKTV